MIRKGWKVCAPKRQKYNTTVKVWKEEFKTFPFSSVLRTIHKIKNKMQNNWSVIRFFVRLDYPKSTKYFRPSRAASQWSGRNGRYLTIFLWIILDVIYDVSRKNINFISASEVLLRKWHSILEIPRNSVASEQLQLNVSCFSIC